MAAEKIMLIRHGEKQAAAEPDVLGVDEQGDADKHSLTVRGWQRAGALVPLFSVPLPDGIAVPATIVAADRCASAAIPAEEGKSRRPIQTVTPLRERLATRAAWLTLPVDDVDALVDAIRRRDGAVLVCWEHRRIPRIAAHFVTDPPDWPGDRFDLVWILDRDGAGYRFSQRNQDLLAGDASA